MDLPNIGLVIDEPYISQIFTGEKTWEMRGTRTGKRQVIGLIKKGTKHIFGTAELFACEGPLSYEQLLSATDKHGISKAKVEAGLLDKWNYAWKLRNIEEFDSPIPYEHPNGAVTWVKLDGAVKERSERHASVPRVKPDKPTASSEKSFTAKITRDISKSQVSASAIPYAKDGTAFTPELSKNGFFTVGEKGDEQKIGSYEEALHYLRKMDKAKWRRPNPKGNWGIVSAVEWR
ncbi:hypothetical protein [Alteromonas pelagimontana]|uniref:hypothetical protein n=1 Tax=Alteromonas pelagimontana TaxID=1858656 RepID=UPI000AC2EA8A|nr:hypothetical protein [Alteromonas pelagimontana]